MNTNKTKAVAEISSGKLVATIRKEQEMTMLDVAIVMEDGIEITLYTVDIENEHGSEKIRETLCGFTGNEPDRERTIDISGILAEIR